MRIVQFLYYLNPKSQASSYLLWLYSPICVGPGRKPRRTVFSQRGSYYVNKYLQTPREPLYERWTSCVNLCGNNSEMLCSFKLVILQTIHVIAIYMYLLSDFDLRRIKDWTSLPSSTWNIKRILTVISNINTYCSCYRSAKDKWQDVSGISFSFTFYVLKYGRA